MTLDIKILISAVFLLACIIHTGWSLECFDPKIKVTVKISDPTDFDDYEQYMFQGVVAYAVRKYCGSIKPADCVPAASNLINTDTANVIISNVTDRFAMCVQVDDCEATLLQNAIKESKPRFNGALVLTDTTLVVEGIPIILQAKSEPAFPIWLIPYIVITCLVIIAAIAILSYTVYQSKKKRKVVHDDYQDEEPFSDHTYENQANPTVTEM